MLTMSAYLISYAVHAPAFGGLETTSFMTDLNPLRLTFGGTMERSMHR